MPGQFDGTRGMAQMYLPELISEGLTNSQIVDFLRINDLGYRASNMYQDINRTRLEQFAAQEIRGMDMDTPIPERLMREWQGKTDFRYRVVVQYDYTIGEGGETREGATTLYYDDPPTINQVLADFGTRTQTIERGFGSPKDGRRIENAREINYFVNRPKE